MASSRNALRPVERRPLYQQVVERLREIIDARELQPGDRLMSERELAQQLGVSRGPVREALQAMRVLGLVEIRHGDGVYLLRPLDEVISSLAIEVVERQANLPQIWEVRKPLESQCAALAARRRTNADLLRMEEALAAMTDALAAGDTGTLADRHFHEAIWAASHSPLLETVIERLAPAFDRASQASLSQPGQPARSLQQHRAIAAAIDSGAESEAREMMLEHLELTSNIAFVRPPD